ncbi:MAG TPA: MFS transporter [Xanthobacteraceae bacterium]|nr:MFS transporter [Xanthobacteraceae bacterium]
MSDARRKLGFVNIAHFIDHYVLLIFPTVVLGLETELKRPYGELIALSTACFVAFGLFSLPAGWLGDHWSRRRMIGVFFLGIAASLFAVSIAPNMIALAAALFVLGIFAAIYHPVGVTVLLANTTDRGRTLATNGVFGNLGVACAPGATALIASLLGWRMAFALPAVLCAAIGVAYFFLTSERKENSSERAQKAEVRMNFATAAIFFGVYAVLSFAGGLVFNTVTVSIPKIIGEGTHGDVPLTWIGSVATIVLLFGGAAQLTVGRLVSRSPHFLFAAIGVMQAIGIVWASVATGFPLLVALAVSIAAIYGQVTVGDVVIARYTADAWRGRIYAVRFFLAFISSGLAVSMIAALYGQGGFPLVLGVTAAFAAVFAICTIAIAVLVSRVESGAGQMQPAE